MKSREERTKEHKEEIRLWQESHDAHQDGCNVMALHDLKNGLSIIEAQQEEIDQLKDDNLHLNEFCVEKGQEIKKLKETAFTASKGETKFLDECAMRAMQTLLREEDLEQDVAKLSYELAEEMLKEKLKREKGDE